MTFAEKVKFVCGELKLSQTQLAKELGISFAISSRWETRKIEPRYLIQVKFYKLCERKGSKV